MFDKYDFQDSDIVLSFSRINASHGETFFGSDVKSNSYIMLTINRATKSRGCGRDSIFPEEQLLRCRLSPIQFSELITRMNNSVGSPGTLEYIDSADLPKNIPKRIHHNKIDQISSDVDKLLSSNLGERLDKVDECISTMKLSKKKEAEMRKLIGLVRQELKENLPFLIKQGQKEISKMVSSAKMTIEHYYTTLCQQAGVKSIKRFIGLGIEDKSDEQSS